MTHSFFGGVYPATRKGSTRRKPLAPLSSPPEEVVLPLVMCADGPSVPLVKAGDRVRLGQPVARRGGDGGAALHASVSGRVVAVEDRPHPWGGSSPAVVIRSDGRDEPWEEGPQPLTMTEVSLTLLTQRVEEAGVVGMGGGCSPTWEKLDRAAGRVDTLIINAAECQPYVTADHRLLLERGKYILRGAELLSRCLGANRTVLVTEGDKLNAVESVERRRLVRGGTVRLCTVRTRYPLGAEKQIVQTVTGREVPPGGSPLDVKCAVFNVATVYAIQDAVFRGRALTHRAVTVTGGAVSRPRNLWVPIGTPLRALAGGLRRPAGGGRPAAHQRPHDGAARGYPGRPGDQGHQLSGLPHRPGAPARTERQRVHPLRQVRGRLPHAPGSRRRPAGPGAARPGPSGQAAPGGLHLLRLLLLHLPGPDPAGGPGAPGQTGPGERGL